ncbi:MAG: polyprenyl synthetase family protein [Pseudomonadales bacterium]|nr:polyprenyl synthetase family protein [Pseudomonadales bacterium]
MQHLDSYLLQCKTRVESTMEKCLREPFELAPQLHEAICYSVFAGGKRLRPVLAYAAAQACGAHVAIADRAACAVEFMHAYSLIHDDLPAMDDDDLRRGKPTCHKVYGEDVAILAGDALQTLAFQVLSESDHPNPQQLLQMVQVLSRSSGYLGMVGGQAYDLASEGQERNLKQLQAMHSLKTGALICASVRLGALSVDGVSDQQLNQLDQYAQKIGLAFQIKDDILDVEADTETLGKPQGADVAKKKATYPALLGLEGAKQKMLVCYQQAINALEPFGEEAQHLRLLAQYFIEREF